MISVCNWFYFLINHCEDVDIELCTTIWECNYTEDGCVLDNYNYIFGGDAQISNFYMTHDFANYSISGECNITQLENGGCDIITYYDDYIVVN